MEIKGDKRIKGIEKEVRKGKREREGARRKKGAGGGGGGGGYLVTVFC